MRRGAAGLLAAVAAGTLLLGGCRDGTARGSASTPPSSGAARSASTSQLDAVESSLDAIEREIDADGRR